MNMEHRDMQYLDMPSLQERPITLGELLFREENREASETTPPRSMGRTMSPTRCLGSLVNGRPRRPRGRTLTHASTSVGYSEDSPSESQQRHRRRLSGQNPIPTLTRWRNATAEARIRNFHSLMNNSRASRRRETSSATRPRHRSLAGRSDSPDLFFNPFSWQRRNSTGGFQRRSQSATSTGGRSRQILQGRSHRLRSSIARVPPGVSRMIDVYDTRGVNRIASYRCLRAYRPRSGRAGAEARRNATNGSSTSEVSSPMRRFIDFAAEFIPVQEQPPDAEPPEWSLNITAADFGPFAIGRSALSRARSLAIMGALSQLSDSVTDEQATPDEN